MTAINSSIYQDIQTRTGGDIYIGVVGPVRTGKSTFIKRFMDTVVLPNITEENKRERAKDELPQSASGRTIMTTEPKFIPEEAVEVNLPDNARFKVRMIDCVGYIVPSSLGYIENDQPRMVKTPWYENEIPFNMAAEIGTQKVINEHSTIGLVVTTDGTITDIPREEYAEVEERVINELKALQKPFIVLLNSLQPDSNSAKEMCSLLSEKYDVPVIPTDCMSLDEDGIKNILAQILFEFSLNEVRIELPSWITGLDTDHWLKREIFDHIHRVSDNLERIRDVSGFSLSIRDCRYISNAYMSDMSLAKGSATVCVP